MKNVEINISKWWSIQKRYVGEGGGVMNKKEVDDIYEKLEYEITQKVIPLIQEFTWVLCT